MSRTTRRTGRIRKQTQGEQQEVKQRTMSITRTRIIQAKRTIIRTITQHMTK